MNIHIYFFQHRFFLPFTILYLHLLLPIVKAQPYHTHLLYPTTNAEWFQQYSNHYSKHTKFNIFIVVGRFCMCSRIYPTKSIQQEKCIQQLLELFTLVSLSFSVHLFLGISSFLFSLIYFILICATCSFFIM